MGKRSRKRGGPAEGRRPPLPPERLSDRARDSWSMAGSSDTARELRRGRTTKRDVTRERPPGLFGPYPVSEFLIFMGIIVLIIGVIRGPEVGPTAFTIGIAMCTLATIEFTLREHLRGFRSHTLFISLLAMVFFHLVVALVGGDSVARSPVLFGLDVAVFATCAYYLLKAYRRATAP